MMTSLKMMSRRWEGVYLRLLSELAEGREVRCDRTGVGVFSVFGRLLLFDLEEGFPLLTTKRVFWRAVVYELLWFLSGGRNVGWLKDRGVHIWDEWADPVSGDLGPVYGVQWRSWPTADGGAVDQLGGVVEELRRNPESRRLVVSAWNVSDVPKMALPPCHVLFQFYAESDGRLSLGLYQRSADVFLGLPFNMASYALLLSMVAEVVGMRPGELVMFLGDAHLYVNHLDQAREQLGRTPRGFPRLEIAPGRSSVDEFCYEDFRLVGYEPHGTLRAPIAV